MGKGQQGKTERLFGQVHPTKQSASERETTRETTTRTRGLHMTTVTVREVSYWAVQGERWCNVTGYVTPALLETWEATGWRVVTRVTERDVEVFGELEE